MTALALAWPAVALIAAGLAYRLVNRWLSHIRALNMAIGDDVKALRNELGVVRTILQSRVAALEATTEKTTQATQDLDERLKRLDARVPSGQLPNASPLRRSFP